MNNEMLLLYRNGPHYDAENVDLVADIPFYLERAQQADGPVLEIACGTGRVTIPLAKAGIDVVGLDLTPTMLAWAREKAARGGVAIEWVEADCRSFSLGRQFALTFCAFNSMQHLHDRESLEAFFECVRAHLLPGGRFIVDVFNPNVTILSREHEQRFPVFTYPNPDGGGDVYVEETTDYDDAAQVSHTLWHYTMGGTPEIQTEQIDLRCFYPQELDMLLHYNGFRIVVKLGNYEGKPFGTGDGAQIAVCALR